MKEASAFAPGHITGLFQICDQPEDPLYKGSRGSGVSISRGVTTRVKAESAEKTAYTVKINGDLVSDAFVSENVIGKMIRNLSEPCVIHVEHELDIPMTAGFGSSGGGALTLSLALNEALGLGYSFMDAARVAHIAEIECKTGLGTVFAAVEGGFGVLVKAGGPGIGEAIHYGNSHDLRVIYVHFGPIQTKEILSNSELREKINELGGGYVDELHRELTPERFMSYSRRFTEHVGLVTPRLRRVFDAADPEGYTFTMAMFGEVAFTLQHKEDVEAILGLLRERVSDAYPVVCGVDSGGTILF